MDQNITLDLNSLKRCEEMLRSGCEFWGLFPSLNHVFSWFLLNANWINPLQFLPVRRDQQRSQWYAECDFGSFLVYSSHMYFIKSVPRCDSSHGLSDLASPLLCPHRTDGFGFQ